MKKELLLLLTCCLLAVSVTNAQTKELWGVTAFGGNNDYGVIYKINDDGSNYTVVHYFDEIEGAVPMGSLMQASDGNLYGICQWGGMFGSCTIYRINPNNNVFEHLYDFEPAAGDGDMPECAFIEVNNKLYATTVSGGAGFIFGVIYSYDINTDTYLTEYDMNPVTGVWPRSPLVAVNNKLYGVSTDKGANTDGGTIYRYDIATDTCIAIHDFENDDNPWGGIVYANDGKLYGTTQKGGVNSAGFIYSVNPSSDTLISLYDLNGPTGTSPKGTLIQGADDKLYGMTQGGGAYSKGVIFQFDPTNTIYTVLHDFDNTNGGYPNGDLVEKDGILYGETNKGGTYDKGVIFSYDLTGNTFVKLHDFDSVTGASPYFGGLIVLPEQIGIDEESQTQLRIYPNPTTGKFRVESSEFGVEIIQVYDLFGRLVLSTNKAQIDMSSYPAGLYVWQVGTQRGKLVLE